MSDSCSAALWYDALASCAAPSLGSSAITLRPAALILCGAVAIGACGGSGREIASDTPPASQANAVAGCAGLTVDKAAAILGVPPVSLQDYSKQIGERMRQCTFSTSTSPRRAVSFTLSPRESESRAVSSMASERESMGFAQRAIDDTTGTASKDPAVEDVSKIGDDAFYSPLNGAIMMRVGSVIVQVMSPNDMAAKKRTAEEIVKGLRP